MLKTRTVPIIPRVAKDESHARAGEARICAGLVSKIESSDNLRYTRLRARPDDDQGAANSLCAKVTKIGQPGGTRSSSASEELDLERPACRRVD